MGGEGAMISERFETFLTANCFDIVQIMNAPLVTQHAGTL